MNSHMAARIRDDFLKSEKRESLFRKKDRADVIILGEDEIGLLDIVLMDAISNSKDAVTR